jgi:hypothetical protein
MNARARRAASSRLFFTLNLVALSIIQIGLAFGLMRIDELAIQVHRVASLRVPAACLPRVHRDATTIFTDPYCSRPR